MNAVDDSIRPLNTIFPPRFRKEENTIVVGQLSFYYPLHRLAALSSNKVTVSQTTTGFTCLKSGIETTLNSDNRIFLVISTGDRKVKDSDSGSFTAVQFFMNSSRSNQHDFVTYLHLLSASKGKSDRTSCRAFSFKPLPLSLASRNVLIQKRFISSCFSPKLTSFFSKPMN